MEILETSAPLDQYSIIYCHGDAQRSSLQQKELSSGGHKIAIGLKDRLFVPTNQTRKEKRRKENATNCISLQIATLHEVSLNYKNSKF